MLSDDVAAAVAELKAKPGRELQVHGSGALVRWLMEHDLVDEINLFTYPLVIGQGTRLFPDTGPDRAFELIESQAMSSGRDRPGLPPDPPPRVRTVDGTTAAATGT